MAGSAVSPVNGADCFLKYEQSDDGCRSNVYTSFSSSSSTWPKTSSAS
ncbi:hypothetical protein AMURIS_00844 [Acetatifactor muris]|uniref:Uncharacterized protein n=1 Tax=Acetatifactor muris TaxID=879566 RepID=A0A2K4ZCE5_9FIRM|nr:hypothetical protein AMURIS_00844 [Acetatifactor muris]